MILTGAQIVHAHEAGEIVIEPFVSEQINPNSYNFRLGGTLREYDADILDPKKKNPFHEFAITAEGFVPEAGKLYLAHTVERLGGVPMLPARRTSGRRRSPSTKSCATAPSTGSSWSTGMNSRRGII